MEIHVLFMEILCTVQSIIILLIIGIVAESSIIVCTYILTFMYAHIYTHSCTAKPVLERVQNCDYQLMILILWKSLAEVHLEK